MAHRSAREGPVSSRRCHAAPDSTEEAPAETIIGLEAAELYHAPRVVAILAHELGHAILYELGLTGNEPNYEPLTDLVPVALGLGVLAANAAVQTGQGWSWGSVSILGYMNEFMYGYALAAYAWMRGEERPDWGEYLAVHIRSYFKQSMDYLEAHGGATLASYAAEESVESGESRAACRAPGMEERRSRFGRWFGRIAGPSDRRAESAGDCLKRATSYVERGDYDLAIADFDRAIELEPHSARSYYRRGLAYFAKGDHDQAIADFDETLLFGGSIPEAWWARGNRPS